MVGHHVETQVAVIHASSDAARQSHVVTAFVMKDGKGHDAVSGAEVTVPEAAEDVVNNNQMRSEFDAALASVKLFSTDAKVRAEAVKTLQRLPAGTLPVAIRTASLQSRYDDPRSLAVTLRVGYLTPKP